MIPPVFSYGPYVTNLDVAYPETLSRWLPFIKWFLAIPHYIVLILLSFVVALTTIGAFFAILFTSRYPRSFFDLAVGLLRWANRVWAYVWLLCDEYPPFRLSDAGHEPYPVSFDVEYPESLSRGLIFVKWLLAAPHWLILAAFGGGGGGETVIDDQVVVRRSGAAIAVPTAVAIVAFFAILFTGRYPQGLFDLSVGMARWGSRVAVYVMLLSDAYPPFRLAR